MAEDVLQQLLRGRGAHADPVACLHGLDLALTGRVLPGVEHTIWAQLWHMNYWMDYELRSLEGPEVPYPVRAAESWPPTPAPPDAAAWQREVERFTAQLAALAGWATRAVGAEGARVVHARLGETVRDVLWQMVAHNSYHTGQVAQLRRAFGAWPPPEGGDTW